MDNGLKAVFDKRVDKIIKNLEKRNMKAITLSQGTSCSLY